MVAWLLALPLVPAVAAGWPLAARAAGPPSPAAVTAVTAQLTGRSDTEALAPQAVCPPSVPGRATCYAQALVVRANGSYVHPALRPAASPVRFFAKRPTAPASTGASGAFAPSAAGAGEPQPGTPAYLQQAYDLSYLSQTQGASDTVAVVDAYDDPRAESDLGVYRAQFGLPPCTTANGCFTKVNQSGQQGSYPVLDSEWALEISLDLDAVSALCPRCHIMLVEASSASTYDLQIAQSTAAQLGAQQISDSWGAVQVSPPAGAFTFAGVATVAAAGDSGYVGSGQNQYPAALAGITAAGGTTLTPDGSARGYSEAAWSGAGSGCDTTQAKPSWQTDAGCTGRSYDDLSADADPQTGLDVYDFGDNGWIVVGGTSEATPLIAAYYAVTGAQAQSPAWAYQHTAQLNDPLTGSNGSCSQSILYICNAGSGYDGPTGQGSVSGAVVTGGAGISGPGPAGSYSTAVGRTTAELQGGIYPNGSDTSWSVQYGTTAAYGQQTAPIDVGAGSAPVDVTALLSGLAAGTQYHYRWVAQNGFGTTYGYDFTLTTALPTAPTIGSPAAAVSGQRATLTAAINPEGAATTVRFDYGTTIALGQSAAVQTVPADAPAGVSATLPGLAAHTTYYYQLFANNSGGAAASPILSFTTGAAAAPSANAASAGSGTLTVGKATLTRGRATIAVACRSGSPCRVRVRLTAGGRIIAAAAVTVPAHHTTIVRLGLGRRNASIARAHRRTTRVAVLERLRGVYRIVASRRVS